MPGFNIQPESQGAVANLKATAADSATGTLSLAELPPSEVSQHAISGTTGPALLYKVTGLNLAKPVQVSLPNTGGYQPGTVLSLVTMNKITGGHDVVGQLVVSPDGKTMTSTGPIRLSSRGSTVSGSSSAKSLAASGGGSLNGGSQTGKGASAASAAGTVIPVNAAPGGGSLGGGSGLTSASAAANLAVPLFVTTGGSPTSSGTTTFTGTWTGCLFTIVIQWMSTPVSQCAGCQPTTSQTSPPGNNAAAGPILKGVGQTQNATNSDIGLVTGEYFQNYETIPYQSQGQEQNIDLQYSSGQADPNPVVQYEFTTPAVGGGATSVSSITAQVTLAGVVQGDPTTYLTPDGLANSTTYNIPLQVDGSELPTGSYPYTMTVTEHFGSEDTASITTHDSGYVNIVNNSSDAMGAGWSVGGLQAVSQVGDDGPGLVTAGQQGTQQFDQVYNDGQTSVQDLAVVSDPDNPQILANDGTGTFTSAESPDDDEGVYFAIPPAAGDFTGNGRSDMAVAIGGQLEIELSNGDGGFTLANTYYLPDDDDIARAVAVGNFTGHDDGTLDIAVLMSPDPFYRGTDGDSYEMAVYEGNGDGSFDSPVVSSVDIGAADAEAYPDFPDSMVAGDFTGDGLDDLAFATDDGSLDVMLNSGGGSFASPTSPHPSIRPDCHWRHHRRLQRRRRPRPCRRDGQQRRERCRGAHHRPRPLRR